MGRFDTRFGLAAICLCLALVFAGCDAGWMALHAGSGAAGNSGDGGPRGEATMQRPGAMVFDDDGGYHVVDTAACVVRHVQADGSIRTVAGDGTCGYAGDGGSATAARIDPVVAGLENTTGGLGRGDDGTLYLADSANGVVRAITPEGIISTFATAGACNGVLGEGGIAVVRGFVVVGCGDAGIFAVADGRAVAVPFLAGVRPGAMTAGPDGSLYHFDVDSRMIRRTTDLTGTTEPVAAIDQPGVTALSVDAEGWVYFVEDIGDGAGRVQRIAPSNMRTTIIVGNLEPDPGVAHSGSARRLGASPAGLAVTPNRGLLVSSGHGVYRIADPRQAPAALARAFYEHDDGVLDGSAPGTIIDFEEIPADQFHSRWKSNIHGTAYRVMYHSRDIHGEDTAVTGVIVVPDAPPPADGRRTVSWTHGNVGMNNWCAPSRFAGWGQEYNTAQVNEYLDDGIVWASTDYEGFGPDGSLKVWSGGTEARNAIDIVRAVHHLAAEPGVALGNVHEDYVVLGNSAGGRASLFANRVATGHDEPGWQSVNLVGTVAGGVPSQLDLLFETTVQQGGLNHYIYNLVFGINATHGDDAAPVSEILNPTGRAMLALAGQSPFDRTRDPMSGYCHPDHNQRFNAAARRISDYMAVQSDGGHNPITNPTWAPLILEQDAATWDTPGQFPLLIIQGGNDVVTRAFSSEMLTDQLCGLGQDVERWNYLDKAHTTAMPAAHDHIRTWIGNRFAGVATPDEPSPVAGVATVADTVCVDGSTADR